VAVVAALVTAGCGSSAGVGQSNRITVFAAASLQATFTRLGTEFEASHPGTAVTFSFAGSANLVTQIGQGAPADVFAAADAATMTTVTSAGQSAGAPANFATNTLQIATPPGNPARIASFADLSRPGVKVVLCAPQVPCGAAARTVQQGTGVRLTPVSEEPSVADVLGKVSSGEADAGLVYLTDVRGAGDRVSGVTFPEAAMAVNTYPIVALTGSRSPVTAADFVAFITGPRGARVLAAAGFGPP